MRHNAATAGPSPGRLGVEGQPGVVVTARIVPGPPGSGRGWRARRCAGIACSTASRAISCAEPQPPAIPGEQPGREELIDGRRRARRDRLSSRSSTRAPISAATSSTSRASPLSRAARASTASRADAGTSPIPACSTSVT